MLFLTSPSQAERRDRLVWPTRGLHLRGRGPGTRPQGQGHPGQGRHHRRRGRPAHRAEVLLQGAGEGQLRCVLPQLQPDSERPR